MKEQSLHMKKYLQAFLKEKPFFFAVVRPKEASLYQQYKPFRTPVLDLGCGDGFFAQVAFGKLDEGIDPDNQAIKEAKNRKIYRHTQSYDGKHIPFRSNYFATVVCNSTYEHIPNLDEVLDETARVLKKGGMLYFTTVTDLWPNYLFGKLIFGSVYTQYFIRKSKHYHMYNIKTWEKKLHKRGLEVVSHVHHLDNKKMMWLFDISHYLSMSALVTKKLFNRWVLFPQMEIVLRPLENYLVKETEKEMKKGPYLFIAAKKK